MATRFEVFLFSPDGSFTADEVYELIQKGFYAEMKEGKAYRLAPIEVKEIEDKKMTISKKPDWHPEYYTMKECFDECVDDDVPYIEGGFNSASLETKKELFDGNDISLYPTASLKQALSDKWQIKRAEPMPYDVDDWLDYIVKLEQSTQTYKEIIQRYDGEKPQVRIDYILKRIAKDSFKEGENSGHINEWLRPEQVELRNFVERMRGDAASYRHDAAKVLENLKPPV